MRGWERAKWAQTQKEGRVYLLLRGWGTGVCELVGQPQRAVHGTWEGRASVTRAPVKVGEKCFLTENSFLSKAMHTGRHKNARCTVRVT